LVTGGAGFIGSHTIDRLLDRGDEVVAIDNLSPPVHPEEGMPSFFPVKAKFIKGDICQPAHMENALAGVDAIFHLAAQQDYLLDFSTFARVNEFGTALLYEIIVRRKLPIKKIVVASSQAVYGEGKYSCKQHGVVFPPGRSIDQLAHRKWDPVCPKCSSVLQPVATDENSPLNPSSHYGISKQSAENWALSLGRKFQIPTVILRHSITQGPRQSPHNAYSGILRSFTTRLLSNKPPTIFEDGRQLRDYVHVKDAVDANLLVLDDDRANYRTFNVGGLTAISVLEYYDKIAECLRVATPAQVSEKFRVGDVRHIFSDSSSLHDLGWKPHRATREIIQDYVDWLRGLPKIPDEYAKAEKVMTASGVVIDASHA
jgi:dTDP-L-rhamnose 4-epimerase